MHHQQKYSELGYCVHHTLSKSLKEYRRHYNTVCLTGWYISNIQPVLFNQDVCLIEPFVYVN